jgi:hypothetical protein
MIPNPWIILAVVIAFVLNGFYWDNHGASVKDTEWVAKVEAERAAHELAARQQEKKWQGDADEIATSHDTEVRKLRSNLTIALNSLKLRPSRPPSDAPAAPRVDCPCSTGAGLCKQDAEFLTRESSRADELRTGLETSYKFIDKVGGAGNGTR